MLNLPCIKTAKGCGSGFTGFLINVKIQTPITKENSKICHPELV